MPWCSGGTAITRWRFSSPRGFLGMMYYFVPRQAQQPLWSYRFSIVNFWALISIYMWAGSHHLLYTALPDWVQSVGMVFSVVLLMPSIGSAANGLMTFNGSWHKVRIDPAAKFMVHGAGLLRGLDVRRFDDGGQVGELADSLHRLDRRARALRRHRLGGDDHHWLAVRDGAARARSSGHAFDTGHEPALLAAYSADCSSTCISMWAAGVTAGFDVARDERGRLADPRLPVEPDRHAALLPGALPGRRCSCSAAWWSWRGTCGTPPPTRAPACIKPILVPAPEAIPEPVPDQIPGTAAGKGLIDGLATNTGKSSRRTRACSAC